MEILLIFRPEPLFALSVTQRITSNERKHSQRQGKVPTYTIPSLKTSPVKEAKSGPINQIAAGFSITYSTKFFPAG